MSGEHERTWPRRARWAAASLGVLVGGALSVVVGLVVAVPAGTVEAAVTVHTGTLEGVTHPFDDYTLNLFAGDVLTVEMVCDASTPLDPALQLLGPAMNVIASDDDGGTVVCQQSRSSKLTVTITVPGAYTIRASSYEIVFDNDPTDDNADGDYTLTIDAPAHSTGFSVAGSLEGVTHPFDDYPVVLIAGDVLTADMVCDPATPLDPALQLLDPAMNVIASDDDGGTVTCQQSRSSRLSYTVTAPGIYTVRASSYEIVFDNDPTDDNADGDYTLTVSAGVLATPSITSPGSLTVPVDTPMAHTFTATGNPPPVLSYANADLPPGVTPSGDTVSGTPTAAGTYSIDVTATNGRMPNATQTFTLTVTGTAPAITSAATLTVAAGASLAHTFSATGAPAPTLSYANEDLPPGVTRSGDVLSGAPTAMGTYSIDVAASNGVDPAATQTLAITVTGTAPTITSQGAISVVAGQPLAHTFTGTGDPVPTLTYANEALPPGVTRAGDTLSGTPSTPGTYGIDVTAENGATATQHLTIEVTALPDTSTSTSSTSTSSTSSSTPDGSTPAGNPDGSTTTTTVAQTTVPGGDAISTTSVAAGDVASTTSAAVSAAGPTVPPAAPIPSATGILPATGADPAVLAGAALLVTGAGIAAASVRRRRVRIADPR